VSLLCSEGTGGSSSSFVVRFVLRCKEYFFSSEVAEPVIIVTIFRTLINFKLEVVINYRILAKV